MQAVTAWAPPGGALGRLCDRARMRAAELERDADHLRRMGMATPPAPSLIAALGGRDVAVIAELKRRSPSRGSLNDTLDAAARATAYAGAGARALSILTEPEEFGGSPDDLVEARRATSVAVLRKDFHVASVQVWEARALGASALLLIARALGAAGVETMLAEARAAGLEALVEVRSEAELDWAVSSGAQLIGVNCRDLETLRVEPDVHERILPLVPPDCLAIAESGVSERRDVLRLAAVGADAVLVGSALSTAGDAVQAVRALTGVAKEQQRRGHDG